MKKNIIKRLLILCLLMVMCLLSFSCKSIFADHKIITDPAEYSIIWMDVSTLYDDALSIFPRSIDGLNCQYFYKSRDNDGIFDDYQQLYLFIKYDEEDFYKELDRISKIKFKEQIKYETDEYELPAYVATEACNCYEYALFDEKEFTIYYIYMYFVSNPVIDESLQPRHLSSCCSENASSFTIYDEW